MTNDASAEHALEVLKRINDSMDETIPEDLVKNCYMVEKRFQYDSDRQLALNELRHLVEAEVERRLEDSNDAGVA